MYNFATTKVLSNGVHIVSIKLSKFDKYIGFTFNRGILHIGLSSKQISIWKE